jgi:REP element-mobilizing transposase RayT
MTPDFDPTSGAPLPSDRGWHFRGYLPHYENSAVIQTITYRLADSLPREVVERLLNELEGNPNAEQEYRRRVEDWLDAGHGSCVLRQEDAARIVIDSWKHFAGQRYYLHAWVVMPNHVHVMAQMIPPCSLGEVVASWKRFSATTINRLLGKPGQLWQEDYWDRYIRDEGHYRAAVDYIHNNPVKAGLVNEPGRWPWSSGSATL